MRARLCDHARVGSGLNRRRPCKNGLPPATTAFSRFGGQAFDSLDILLNRYTDAEKAAVPVHSNLSIASVYRFTLASQHYFPFDC
jgi:hypothetical protein